MKFAGVVRVICAAILVTFVSLPVKAAQGGAPPVGVVVTNPITLNPNTANPVTIVNPAGAPPTVNIGNPNDIAKAGGIQHPTQLGGSCIYQVRIVCESIIDVPANQRLIIEYVSVYCEDMSTLLVGVNIATIAGGAFTTHQLTTDHSGVLQSDNVKRRMSFGQMVRLYADPGSKITIDAETPDASNRGDCGYALSGQAIDVP